MKQYDDFPHQTFLKWNKFQRYYLYNNKIITSLMRFGKFLLLTVLTVSMFTYVRAITVNKNFVVSKSDV